MKETFREKNSVIGNYLSSEAIKRQSLENSLAFRRPFFCEIEKQLLEKNALLKPQGICPPLKSSVVFSVQNKNQRLCRVLIGPKKNVGNNF